MAFELGEAGGSARWTGGRSTLSWRYAKTAEELEYLGEAGARTSWTGNIIVAPGTKGSELLSLLKHEARHQFLSPKGDFIFSQMTRAKIKATGYWRSHFLRWSEEAIAEGSASYPFQYPRLYKLSKPRVVAEGIGILGGLTGLSYGTYKVTEKVLEEPGQ